MKNIIYLDLNKWIDLSRAYYDRSDGKQFKNVLNLLTKHTKNGNIVIPISLINVFETAKSINRKRREKLARFMVELSDSNAILPFMESIYEAEITLSLCKIYNIPYSFDIKKIIIGKGIEFILGMKPQIKNIPNDQKEMIFKFNKDKDMIVNLIIESHNLFKVEGSFANNAEHILNLEQSRQSLNKGLGEDARLSYSIHHVLTETILPFVKKYLKNSNLDKDVFYSQFCTKEDLHSFILNIPTIYTFIGLRNESTKNLNRSIHKNDDNDLLQLITAIPYCDVVVAEKHWIDQARRCKLDEIYNCKLLTSINDLLNIQFN